MRQELFRTLPERIGAAREYSSVGARRTRATARVASALSVQLPRRERVADQIHRDRLHQMTSWRRHRALQHSNVRMPTP